MSPSDILPAIGILAKLIALGILALGIYRAIEMGRSFVSRMYRSRAFWSAAVMILVIVDLLNNYVPYPSSPAGLPASTAFLIGVIGALPFAALAIVIFAFIDSTVLVAMEMDFFHRNTFRWPQLRRPFYILLLGGLAFAITFGSLSGLSENPPPWEVISVTAVFFAVFGVIFVYLVAALVVGARRTPDRAMKKHVRLLGFAVACFVVAGFSGNSSIPALFLVNDFVLVAAAYLLYSAVMSLSIVSPMEKEIA